MLTRGYFVNNSITLFLFHRGGLCDQVPNNITLNTVGPKYSRGTPDVWLDTPGWTAANGWDDYVKSEPFEEKKQLIHNSILKKRETNKDYILNTLTFYRVDSKKM